MSKRRELVSPKIAKSDKLSQQSSMIIMLLICILFVTINYIRIEGPKSLYIPKTLNQKELPLSYPVPLCLRRFFQRFSRTEEFRSLNTVLCPRIPGMSGSHGLRPSIVELFATTKRFGFYCSLAKKYIKILIKMPLSFRFFERHETFAFAHPTRWKWLKLIAKMADLE